MKVKAKHALIIGLVITQMGLMSQNALAQQTPPTETPPPAQTPAPVTPPVDTPPVTEAPATPAVAKLNEVAAPPEGKGKLCSFARHVWLVWP